jgi:hypothetical protein
MIAMSRDLSFKRSFEATDIPAFPPPIITI